MPRMTFTGNLKSVLDDLAFTMTSLFARSGGSRIEFGQPGFSGVTLVAETRFGLPSSGDEFLTGQIDRLRFDETTIDGLSTGRLLLIENMNVGAERVFDVVFRVPGEGSYGSVDSNAFSNYLDNRDWRLVGSSDADTVVRSARMSLEGDDVILGKGGSDYLKGGRGNDRIEGNVGTDSLFGQAGADRLFGGDGRDGLNGGAGRDRLYGGDSNDRLLGGADGDWLFGGKGIDILYGGSGRDTLNGGGSSDALTGGRGADTFVFGANHGDDRIRDFQNNIDALKFSNPGQVTLRNTAEGALFSSSDGSVLVVGVSAGALTLEDGLWS